MPLLTHWESRNVEAWRALWEVPHLEVHDVLGSTNDRAKGLARERGSPWAVVMAEAQTHGRGRDGKGWASPEGKGLWISLLVPSAGSEADLLLPLRVGLAAARVSEAFAPTEGGILVKWPNDLLLSGRKVGGILCETAGTGCVVVGLGLNVRQEREDYPPGLREKAISLEVGSGKAVSRGALAEALIRGIRAGIEGGGARLTSRELEEFSRRDALLGERVDSQAEGSGVALGITPRGSLILEVEGGALREVRAGSIQTVR